MKITVLVLLLVIFDTLTWPTEASPEKRTWPEVVGQRSEKAVEAILAVYPDIYVEVVLPGSPLTLEYRDDRVRVHVDDQDIVEIPPSIG